MKFLHLYTCCGAITWLSFGVGGWDVLRGELLFGNPGMDGKFIRANRSYLNVQFILNI